MSTTQELFVLIVAQGASQRFALGAGCHENQLTKRNQDFEREDAAKRNVANRPLARIVGWLLTFVTFAELLENNL